VGSEAFPQMDYASEVNSWIETNKGAGSFRLPRHAFGMVKLTPHSKNQDQGGGGYNSASDGAGFLSCARLDVDGAVRDATSGGSSRPPTARALEIRQQPHH